MLVNQRSHAHGQGWTDLNFLIPELATGLRYKKGPYDASEGDFASAGAVEIRYADSLERGIASVGLGQNGFRRVLLADSPALGDGKLLYAIEGQRNDGPFVHPDNFRKFNGVLRYSQGDAANGWNLTGLAYTGKWNSTDQIAKRAVDAGTLDRFDAIDPTDGGRAHRYSLSGARRRTTEKTSTQVNAYVASWLLDLYSNFTYFLDNPVDGDQFAQPDRRTMSGINARHAWQTQLFGRDSENQVGVQFQNDNIYNGLLNTKARETLSATRRDHIVETSVGVWFQNATEWSKTFRTVAGVRADRYRFDVSSDLAANTGVTSATKLSPKLNLIFGPWDKTELYVNPGHRLSQQRRTRHGDKHRPQDRRPGRARHTAGALQGLRGGRADVADRGLADFAVAVPARLSVGTGLRRRCRQHRSGPAQQAHRLRVGQLLQSR
jgi:hypothetical protein